MTFSLCFQSLSGCVQALEYLLGIVVLDHPETDDPEPLQSGHHRVGAVVTDQLANHSPGFQ